MAWIKMTDPDAVRSFEAALERITLQLFSFIALNVCRDRDTLKYYPLLGRRQVDTLMT